MSRKGIKQSTVEAVLIATPLFTISSSIFNYLHDTFRNPDLHFTISGFLKMLGSSIVYAVFLSIFSYFFILVVYKKIIQDNIISRFRN